MNARELRHLRAELSGYISRSDVKASILLLVDLAIYNAFLCGAMTLDDMSLRVLCAIGSGGAISTMFVLGHDAVHGVLARSKSLNRIYGRIAFLPALHNYSLWILAHNQMHHVTPNFQGKNSWSPFSKTEYDVLPPWKRLVERFLRSPPGIGVYYFFKRWLADKFYPRSRTVGKHATSYWADFGLLLTYIVLFNLLLYAIDGWTAVLLGFVVPYVVWNYLVGFTVLLQHTHPSVPCFRDEDQWMRLRGQEELTIRIKYPRWYGLISHDIMEHPAHHILPWIPCYNIHVAQNRLDELLGNMGDHFQRLPWLLFEICSKCQLYDYDNHTGLDFQGRPTTGLTLADGTLLAA